MWSQIAYLVVTVLVGALLVPYLKQKAAAAKAERDKFDAESRLLSVHVDKTEAETERTRNLSAATILDGKGMLMSQVEEFLFMRAADIAESRFPVLCQRILTDGLKKDDVAVVKNELQSWGKELKTEVMDFFKVQGLDLVAELGDKYLDQLIEHAANKMSPFPGKGTAVELLTTRATNWIIGKGVDVVRKKYLDGNEAPDAGKKNG